MDLQDLNPKYWPDWISYPLVVLAIYFAPDFFLWLDPTSHTVHVDFWQHVLYATLPVILFSGVAYAGILCNNPNLFKWYRENFDKPSPDAHWLLFAHYALLMLCMVLVLMAII